jgi:hypothetical protein
VRRWRGGEAQTADGQATAGSYPTQC